MTIHFTMSRLMIWSQSSGNLLLVRDRLCSQELVDTPLCIEATEPAGFGSTMWQCPFVVDCHRVDVYSTDVKSVEVLLTA